MTLSTTTIPFSEIKFIDHVPRLSKIEERLTDTLRKIRRSKQPRLDTDDLSLTHVVNWCDLIQDADTAMIKRRALRFVERLQSRTGTHHLPERDRATLTALRGAIAVARITTEHEADEIAAALHEEMPWMAPATEVVWQGLRASARDGLPGLRISPLVLLGAPSIGKSFWTRLRPRISSIWRRETDLIGRCSDRPFTLRSNRLSVDGFLDRQPISAEVS